jgi:hypothetical protein
MPRLVHPEAAFHAHKVELMSRTEDAVEDDFLGFPDEGHGDGDRR